MWGGVYGGRECKRVIAEPVLPCLGPWTRSQVSPHPSLPTCTVGFLTTLLIRSWNPCLKKCGTKRVLKLLCLCLLVAPKLSGNVGVSGQLLSKCVLPLGEGRISHPHLQVATVLGRKAASPSVVRLDPPQVLGAWVISSSLLSMLVRWRSLAGIYPSLLADF